MTECNQETFAFTAHFTRRVEAGFTAGQVSTDGGSLLLRQTDHKINLLGRLSGCFTDKRDPDLIAAPAVGDALATHLWVGVGLRGFE